MADPLPQATVDAILADIRAGGKSCRAVAREHGVSHSKVSTLAKQHGLSFDRIAQTAAGTAAAKFDAKEARIAALERLYRDEARLAERFGSPYTFVVTSSLGAQFVTMNEPPLKEQKDAAAARSQLLTIALRLEAHDAADEAEAGKTMVNDLFGALGMVYHQIIAEEQADTEFMTSGAP